MRNVTGRLPACVQHIAIEHGLALEARQRLGDHELKLGAEQADAFGANIVEVVNIEREASV